MVDTILAYAGYLKKFLIYVAGVAGQLLTLGLVPAPAQSYVSGFIIIITGLGIYQADNGDKPGRHAAQPID